MSDKQFRWLAVRGPAEPVARAVALRIAGAARPDGTGANMCAAEIGEAVGVSVEEAEEAIGRLIRDGFIRLGDQSNGSTYRGPTPPPNIVVYDVATNAEDTQYWAHQQMLAELGRPALVLLKPTEGTRP